MENESVIERTVNLVIDALRQMNFFEGNSMPVVWHLRWNSKALSSRRFRAAATAHGNEPVMVLPEDFNLERDIAALIHESIHLAQIAKGDFVPGYGDGTAIWKGQRYNILSSGHDRYFKDQPWEEEAQNIFPDVVKIMNEQ
jgi:hypothetical protein